MLRRKIVGIRWKKLEVSIIYSLHHHPHNIILIKVMAAFPITTAIIKDL